VVLTKQGQYWYGSNMEDLQQTVISYSRANKYVAQKFRASVCTCGNEVFRLESDANEGISIRTCTACGHRHVMGDGADYLDEANPGRHECLCGGEAFRLLTGVALYKNSDDVRWNYVGCHCTSCNLVGVFADWKCEAGASDPFLNNV
jgi:hypothetical protein